MKNYAFNLNVLCFWWNSYSKTNGTIAEEILNRAKLFISILGISVIQCIWCRRSVSANVL
jgi:hypothetical protein